MNENDKSMIVGKLYGSIKIIRKNLPILLSICVY